MSHYLFDDPQALLAETRSLRALARSLAADAPGAEDLVQSTWLAALCGRPPATAPGSWLRGILRNLFRQEQRSSRRRVGRERAAARPEAHRGAMDNLEHLELLHAVVAAVRGLPEPYRDTVLARYFREETPKEMASHLAVPVATIHTRLHRAIGMLRDALDQRFVADRSWRRGLVLLTTKTPVPSFLMSSKLKTAAGIVVLLGSFWAVFGLLPTTSSLPKSPMATITGDSISPPAPGEIEGTSDLPRARTPPRAAELRGSFLEPSLAPYRVGWTGRVVRGEDGVPIPFASVLVDQRMIATDEHGRFMWLHTGGRTRPVEFTGIAPGRVGQTVSAAADHPAAEIVLPVFAAASVELRVLDIKTRDPVEGVEVVLRATGRSSGSRTDSTGTAMLAAFLGDMPEAIGKFTILNGPAWGGRFERTIRAGQTQVIECLAKTYPRFATLRAVHGETSAPLSSVRFRRAIAPDPGTDRWKPSTRLDPEWSWESVELEGAGDGSVAVTLPADEPAIFVLAEADGFHSAACMVVAESASVFELPLWPLDSVPVEVFANGQPLPGPSVVHVGLPPAYWFLPTGTSSRFPGRGPRFRIPGFPMQRFTLETDARGHTQVPMPATGVPELFALSITGPGGEPRDYGMVMRRDLPEPPWRLDLMPGRAKLTVRVETQAGEPIAGATVETDHRAPVDWEHESRLRGATFLSERFVELGVKGYGRTDEHGEVEIEVMAPARVSVKASWIDAEAEDSLDLSPQEQRTVTLAVRPLAGLPSITGRLVPRAGRLPETRWRARIVAIPLDTDGSELPIRNNHYASINVDGTFVLHDVQPGPYALVVPWSLDRAGVPMIAHAGDAGLVLTTPPVRSFRIEVVDAVSGDRVNSFVRIRAGTDNAATIGSLRNDGVVIVENLSADVREIEVQAQGYEPVKMPFDGMSPILTVRLERVRSQDQPQHLQPR